MITQEITAVVGACSAIPERHYQNSMKRQRMNLMTEAKIGLPSTG
jgi:hypothetical protein